MSEFTCIHGCEPVPSGTKDCPVCGSPICCMDGKTSKQINAEEKAKENI
jgi:hypothetical protein|tara:strand:- start:1742 stop:1888 length:147 start_codon:yes stop_codon:yes gene_type:complete